MRISRRTSGGRGEYEISEPTANGVTPGDLFGRRIYIELHPELIINTDVQLTPQGGKRRLRIIGPTGIQVHRQVAAALLMPHSVRADEALGRGAPVMHADRYAIEHIEITEAELIGDHSVRLRAGDITIRNLSHHAEQVSADERSAHLQHLWANADELPNNLADLVYEHRQAVISGEPISKQVERMVADIQHLTTENAADLGLIYRAEGQDVLPDLLESLKEPPPQPPITVEEIDPDQTEIRRRAVKEWKRWAASRGAASARFRQAVRAAWNSTCAVCGLHLPPTSFNSTPGVDAAHILPWADYDLDQVSNGICLCKHHHWAFDEGLIVIRTEGHNYRIEIPEHVACGIAIEAAAFGLASLQQHAGVIPPSRLPQNPADRPRAQYLEMLRESS